nr:hypothetical protein [Ferrimonas aestuarii]
MKTVHALPVINWSKGADGDYGSGAGLWLLKTAKPIAPLQGAMIADACEIQSHPSTTAGGIASLSLAMNTANSQGTSLT